ncbi:PRAME family member 20-like [Ictidomys tridecemlineatus]
MAVGTPHPSQEDGHGVYVWHGVPAVQQQTLPVEPDSVHALEMAYRAAAGLPPGAADMCRLQMYDTGQQNWLQLDHRVLDHDLPKKPGPVALHLAIRFRTSETPLVSLGRLPELPRMSIHSPPTLLLELAGHSLLSNKSRALLDLEDLPIELFPPLFEEAFSRGHTEVLKKIVQPWPFTHLPLGALIRKPQLEIIQVALDGLDMLFAQQDHPRQRRDKLYLCCNRLKIVGKLTSYTRKVLRLLQLDSVQKVEVHCAWAPFTLAACAPFFRQMRNLRKLLVSKIYVSAYTSQEEQEQLLTQLTSQFLRIDCLQKFCANALFLLEGHLEQVLRNLKTPMETLSITNCPLSDSDWNYLSRYPNARQLRHLELRGIKLTDFSLEPLQILLDSTATTLNILDLAACGITDSQLQALLPALSRCSQLVFLSIHGNHLSISTLRDLLLHTARLSHLSVELYSAPLKSYDARGTIHPGRFSQLCAELTAILRDFRQPNIIVFCTVPCRHCGSKFLYNQGLIHCSCPTAA